MTASRHVKELAETLGVSDDTLQEALVTSLRATVLRVARERTLFDSLDRKGFYRVENIALRTLEGVLNQTVNDEDDREFARWVIHRELANHSLYTPPTARDLLKREVYGHLVEAHPSPRWREVADMLWRHKYFENVDVNDVMFERAYARPWSSQGLSCNGLGIGWNTDLMHGQARIGIDPIWNKVSDALMLVWWPDADKVGKRRWTDVTEALDDALDPKSRTHRDLVRDRRGIRDEMAFELRT